MKTKQQTNKFEFVHPVSKDVFTYSDKEHEYKLNGIELPGTTTPLKLVNELSWDANGKMTDKSFIIQQWAVKLVTNGILEEGKKALDLQDNGEYVFLYKDLEEIVVNAKKLPNQKFKGAGVSGTDIHEIIEGYIKDSLLENNGFIRHGEVDLPQVNNFIEWASKNKVKFLFSEEPIYSKEWMNCGTVDFICEIDGKILIGDIKTNGDKRRYEWNTKTNQYDFTKPVSDIHTPALWQTGAYGKMASEDGARKLIDKFDGIVVVNIKKSGEFDESLDVRYNYNPKVLIEAYDHVINLYKLFRNQL